VAVPGGVEVPRTYRHRFQYIAGSDGFPRHPADNFDTDQELVTSTHADTRIFGCQRPAESGPWPVLTIPVSLWEGVERIAGPGMATIDAFNSVSLNHWSLCWSFKEGSEKVMEDSETGRYPSPVGESTVKQALNSCFDNTSWIAYYIMALDNGVYLDARERRGEAWRSISTIQ
jgi:hypothetical protein